MGSTLELQALMWGKQNDGQMIQNPPAQPVQPAPASAPVISHQRQAPPPAPTPTSPTTTVFGKSMKIIGEVTSDEELYLDGDLDGKLNLRNRLTVGPNSKVNANIKAQEIIVFGTIRGNVESETAFVAAHRRFHCWRYQDCRHRNRRRSVFQRRHRYLQERRRQTGDSQGAKCFRGPKTLIGQHVCNSFTVTCVQLIEAAPSEMRNM